MKEAAGTGENERGVIEMADTESLVPPGHPLRQVDAAEKSGKKGAISVFDSGRVKCYNKLPRREVTVSCTVSRYARTSRQWLGKTRP